MKHANLLSFILLFFLGTVSTRAYALRVYTPNSNRTMSANRAYCLGATPANITFTYNICNVGTGSTSGTMLNVSWYSNTVNDTTSGTLISTTSVACARSTAGSAAYLPVITTPGTKYYYCVITWDTTGTCNTTGTLVSSATRIIVSETPGAVTGNSVICMGTPTTYTNSASGGTWSRSNTRVTIDASTGYATGVSAGAVNINYRVACGTIVSKTVTVTVVPTVNAITGGNTEICVGRTTALNCTPSGGVWSSGNDAVATIGTNRVVTGVSPGTVTITYTRSNACGTYYATKIVTVTAAPSAIAGDNIVCIGTPTTYTNDAPGGTWASSNTRLTMGLTTGEANGVTTGSVRIYYRMGCGLRVSRVLTVSAVPTVNAISGGTNKICQGATTTLSCSPSGGVWTSANTAVATIGTNRVVTGIAPGTATITYTRTNTCGTVYATKVVTITAAPAAISGDATTCSGYTIPYTNTTPFGIWTTSNSSIATIGSATGMLNAVAAGTVRVTYNTGCTPYVTKSITVNATPPAITGSTLMCGAGATTTLANTIGGGTWSSSTPAVATVDTAGVVTGVSFGTATITYDIGNPCPVVAVVTVGATPASNTGTLNICSGATTTLANAVAYGAWSSSDTTIASIDASGLVTGIAQGTATITYNTGCGTVATSEMTINAQPAAITGTVSVCAGTSATLSNSVSGGVWSSENTSIATVNASTGSVTGVSEGTVVISYVNGVCYSMADATVNPMANPGTISGGNIVCEGDVLGLTSDGETAGTWTGSNNAIATVSAAGILTGILSGTVNVSYTVSNACGAVSAVQVVSVNAAPVSGSISGASVLCQEATTSLTSSVTGGAWFSDNTSIATIGATGVVTGVAGGNVTISYVVSNTCGSAYATQVLTVDPLPSVAAISGSADICPATSSALTNATTGGVWSSANASVATIGTDGVVTGVAAGTATISYGVTNGCGTTYVTKVATVNALSSAGTLSGAANVCVSANTTFTSSVAGGDWISSNAAVATVGTDGVVSGVAAGTATISYEITGTCGTAYATRDITVDPLPDAGALSGSSVTCISSTTSLTPAVTGGVWSSSDASVATVGTTGVVAGITGGSATVTYEVSNGCGTDQTTQVVTVTAVPSSGSITGSTVVCPSSTITLSNAVSGGVWSSTNVAAATVDTNGVVTGVANGTTTISYTVSNACGTSAATLIVSVGITPVAITGSNVICMGGNTTLSIADAAGTWTSSNPAQASVNATTGVVTSVSLGTSIITYTSASGCFYSTHSVTVSTTVPGITGTAKACLGFTSTLSNPDAGGVWSSSNAAIASVDASTGVVTAVTPGSVTISYTVAGGCFAPVTFFSYANPTPITGVAGICSESYTVLYSTIGGSGTWSSSDTAVASANLTSGMVNGLSAGTAVISYMVAASGCYVTKEITVNQTPAAITGASAICNGGTQTFASATSGGTWSSFQPSVASVNASTGAATALTAGNTIISYTMSTGCYRAYSVTVNPLPETITASSFNICLGIGTTLSSATTGGTWTSGNTAIATINATSGVATSMGLGTTTISYTNANGCAATANLTVYSGLAAITGDSVLCKGYTTTLADATAGGTWSTSNSSIASVNSVTGVINGMNGGTARITYRLSGGCIALKAMTVAAITGNFSLCAGTTSTLSHLVPGGTWSSSNIARATVDSATGIVTAVSVGSAIITYRVSPSKFNTAVVQVYNLPAAITGSSAFCTESSSLYTGTIGGSATWSSSNVGVVTIGSTSGLAYGVAAGSATITYKVPTSGCYTTRTISVNPAPTPICGPSTICVGAVQTYTNTTTDGIWASTPTTVASVGSVSGVVTGLSAGGFNISYTLTNGCRKVKAVTVNAIPAAITGPTSVAQGGTVTLNSSTAGGTWSSANAAVAAPATTTSISGATTTTGLVSGISAGATVISYTMANGCSRTVNMNVLAGRGVATETEIVSDAAFRMFPNPSNGAFTVESDVNGVFAIFTFDGKLVSEHTITDRSTAVSLPSGLAAGIYVCQFRFEDGSVKTAKLYYQQ
jgi:trimeric autotransporter adhesin